MTGPRIHFVLLFLLTNTWPIETKSKETKLILFLLDGFRWDYFDQPNINLPAFKRLLKKGVRANYTTADFPTLSIPNYYTIMTGLHTENHGMIDNYMYDENIDKLFLLDNITTWADPAWWQGGEPLWVTAEKQKKSAYMFYWAGCDVNIRGKPPTFCEPYFSDNAGNVPGVQSMSSAINKAIQLFKNDSADMVGIYVETSDLYGHAVGPNSPVLYQQLEEIDGVLNQLLDNLTAEGLDDEVAIIIFSDHGMTGITPQKAIQLTDYINIQDLKSPVMGAGAICSIWPKDDKMEKVYNDTLRAKNERGHIEVYKKADIPDKWYYKNNDRVAPITVVADLGYFLLQDNQICIISGARKFSDGQPYEWSMSEQHPGISYNCSDCKKPRDWINKLIQDIMADGIVLINRQVNNSKVHENTSNNFTETKSVDPKYINVKDYQMKGMVCPVNDGSREGMLTSVRRSGQSKGQYLKRCKVKSNIKKERKNRTRKSEGKRVNKKVKTCHSKSKERSACGEGIRKANKESIRERENIRRDGIETLNQEHNNNDNSKWNNKYIHENKKSDIKKKGRGLGKRNYLTKEKYNEERKKDTRIRCQHKIKKERKQRNGNTCKERNIDKYQKHKSKRINRKFEERSRKVKKCKERKDKGNNKGRFDKEKRKKD